MLPCCICFMDYNTAESKPVVGTCGHTICHNCSLQIEGKCPTCRKDSFRSPVINFHVLEQMKEVCVLDQVEAEKEDGKSRTHENGDKRFEQIMKLTLIKLQRVTEGIDELQGKMDVLQNENRELKEDMKELRAKMNLQRNEDQNINVSRPKQETASLPHPSQQPTTYQPLLATSLPRRDGSLQCWSCSSVLTRALKRRKDGVSVICICRRANIVVAKEGGYKWMENYCLNGSCFRESCFQQWPVDVPANAPVTCPRCNYKAAIFSASNYEAKPAIQNGRNGPRSSSRCLQM